jgi:hypothetical protein
MATVVPTTASQVEMSFTSEVRMIKAYYMNFFGVSDVSWLWRCPIRTGIFSLSESGLIMRWPPIGGAHQFDRITQAGTLS